MRVASRNRWTFRLRLLTNVIAFLLSAPLIALGSQKGFSGADVFRTITFLGFFFCLIQGMRRAASSICPSFSARAACSATCRSLRLRSSSARTPAVRC